MPVERKNNEIWDIMPKIAHTFLSCPAKQKIANFGLSNYTMIWDSLKYLLIGLVRYINVALSLRWLRHSLFMERMCFFIVLIALMNSIPLTFPIRVLFGGTWCCRLVHTISWRSEQNTKLTSCDGSVCSCKCVVFFFYFFPMSLYRNRVYTFDVFTFHNISTLVTNWHMEIFRKY